MGGPKSTVVLDSECVAISRSFFPKALNKIILTRRTMPAGGERDLAKRSNCSRTTGDEQNHGLTR